MGKKKTLVIFLPLIIVISVFVLKFWAQEECTEFTIDLMENFDTTDYKDLENCSIANWPPGPIHLNYKGANFEITEPTGMGAKIYVCTAGHFDGNKFPDMVGLDVTDDEEQKLVLIRNVWEDIDEDGIDDDGIIFQVDPTEVYDWFAQIGPAAMTTADFNGDGMTDFFFYGQDTDQFAYDDKFVACMYINNGTENNPNYERYFDAPNLNFTDRFKSAGIYANWSGDHVRAVDLDQDGDQDMLVISEDKIFLLRNPGPASFTLDNWEISELNYDQNTGFNETAYPASPPSSPTNRGGTAVNAADFDNDGDIDIIGGSVNRVDHLVYYENDGTGYFTRDEILIPEPNCLGTVALFAQDFNKDGLIDIYGANDAWNAGNEAHMWYMRNQGLVEGSLQFSFECQNDCLPILPDPHDVDLGAALDYDQDGDMDIILADGNHSGDYYLIRNDLAPIYTTYGEAWSLNIAPSLDPTRHAVTKIKINGIKQKVRGDQAGLKVEIWVSNNARDWELYIEWEGNEIHNYPGGGKEAPLPHSFTHFGSQLRWKIIMSAPEDPMEEYTGASYDTPEISEINWQYTYVEQREYSRTSVATTVVEGEEEKELIIAGTFVFPGWRGYLRAYDVSAMALEETSDSVLRTISRPDISVPGDREIVPEGVSILWDAGDLLASREASSRAVYTATPVSSVLTRLDFTTTNVGTLGPILQDFNNDNEGLINFVRGEGREWKLGDINHSNPVAVGPPDGVVDLKGTGYDAFMSTWENRQKVLYAGANDGMLHCFDVLTGEELWAYIPYNLLPRLRGMWRVDEITGERYFERMAYVDGSPVVEDVYIDVDGDSNKEWITILVCGQGRGQGSTQAGGTTGNFYFALDITDPANPQPLWEFTHDRMGETWSVPVIGKVTKGGADTWAAFMGSGYDNVEGSGQQGNVFYVVDLETGQSFWEFDAGEVDTSAGWFWNIDNCFSSSPSWIDTDSDGFVDRVYIGDLDGRMWKVDVSTNFIDQDSWSEVSIYEDSNNYPILTKPALWINPISTEAVPHLYFGTGGDDYALPDAYYSFIALTDGAAPEVQWYLGDQATLGLPLEKDVGDMDEGEKVWADPKVADYVVYFSTLKGSIEAINPCENIAGEGKLYARYIQAVAGGSLGGTALKTASGPSESLALAIKTRAAVTLGERERSAEAGRKREVYIQEYDSTIQKLEQGAIAMLKVKSVREIFRVVR
jgi:hypothetical protein